MNTAILYRTTIKVERPTITRDALGTETATYAIVHQYKASVQPANPDERVQYGRLDESNVIKVYVPNQPSFPDINLKDRIKIGTKSYLVVSISNQIELNYATKYILTEIT